MQEILTEIVLFIGKIHSYIGRMNKGSHSLFTDKDLHLIVMAIIGVFIFLFTYLIFWFIQKKLPKSAMFIVTFIYTFTVLVVITFAIEIGQKITNTGNMEFADILYGLWGFLIAFGFLLAIMAIVWVIRSIIKEVKQKNKTYAGNKR